MNEVAENKVIIFTDEAIHRGGGFNVFRRKENPVDIDEIKKNMDLFYKNISKIIESVADNENGFKLDEITINAEIGASGSVGFLGTGATGSAKAGISIKLKRK